MDTPEQRRVLVVEPDPGIRALVVAVLRREGYTADAVDNVQAALQARRGPAHDAVVLDPRVRGSELLLAALRSDGLNARVVIITTPDWRDPVYRGGDGVHAVLLKPFSVEELAELVGSCLDVPVERRAEACRAADAPAG